jgi:hypothetical protein
MTKARHLDLARSYAAEPEGGRSEVAARTTGGVADDAVDQEGAAGREL